MQNQTDVEMNVQDIRAIAFDAFGTLVKISKPHFPYKRLLQWLVQQQFGDAAILGRRMMTEDLSFSDMVHAYGHGEYPASELQQRLTELQFEIDSIELFPETLAVLQQLKEKGYALILCSNLAQPYGEKIKPMLPLFDAYAMSYEVGAIKPEAEIYQSFLTQLDLQPEHVLFIGDQKIADVDGPNALGIYAEHLQRKQQQDLWHGVLSAL